MLACLRCEMQRRKVILNVSNNIKVHKNVIRSHLPCAFCSISEEL